MSVDLRFDGFACPGEGLSDNLLAAIAIGHAQQVVQTFVDRHVTTIEKSSEGLISLIQSWVDGADNISDASKDFALAWNPAFGDIHANLLGGSGNPVFLAVTLGLHLSASDIGGDWTANLVQPATLRFGGWVLAGVHSVSIRPSAGRATFATGNVDGSRSKLFVRSDEGWRPGKSRAGLPVIARSGLRFTLLDPGLLPQSAAHRLLHADAYSFDADERGGGADWRATCARSMDLIGNAAGEYAPWVGRVVHTLVPLIARPGLFNSGSERFSPGVVCLSDHCYRWPLAEMLVHEATHQYLHILNLLGPLDDGSDETLYFSPFRNKERPIFFIVVAYHAFANVLLFYRTARANGFRPDEVFDNSAFTDREGTLSRQLDILERHLDSTPALTALGRALWEPLRDRLHALSVPA